MWLVTCFYSPWHKLNGGGVGAGLARWTKQRWDSDFLKCGIEDALTIIATDHLVPYKKLQHKVAFLLFIVYMPIATQQVRQPGPILKKYCSVIR